MIRAVTSKPSRRSATTSRTAPPVCLYLEVTNRCNLLCETCPRTFEDLEPPADMSWALFTRIVDQVPECGARVLHGVGEPMLVKALAADHPSEGPRTQCCSTPTARLLNPKKFQEIIDTGLDELRVSLDAADRVSYAAIRAARIFFRRLSGCWEVHGVSAADGVTHGGCLCG